MTDRLALGAAGGPGPPNRRSDRCRSHSHSGPTSAMMSPQPPASVVAHPLRVPVLWGLAFGAAPRRTAARLRWLDPATVHALGLVVIASVYVGFAVGEDGRGHRGRTERRVRLRCRAAAAVTATPGCWCRLCRHGLKDLWQHRSHFVANTRWWPPFCASSTGSSPRSWSSRSSRVFSSTVSAASPSTPSRSNTAWSLWASDLVSDRPDGGRVSGYPESGWTLVSWDREAPFPASPCQVGLGRSGAP